MSECPVDPRKIYENTNISEPVLDEAGLVKYASCMRFSEALCTNQHGGTHAEVTLDDGKTIGRSVEFKFSRLYSRFGVSEDKEDANKKAEKKEKTYGLACPMKYNPQLNEPVAKLDDATITQYALNSKAYTGATKPQSRETAESLLISAARPPKKAESLMKYGANFKFKFGNDTQYYIKSGKFDRPVERKEIEGKEGYFTIFGRISKLHVSGKYNLVFQGQIVIVEIKSKVNAVFASYLNLAPPEEASGSSATNASTMATSGTATTAPVVTSSTSTSATSTSSTSASASSDNSQGLGVTGSVANLLTLDDKGCVKN